MPGAARADVEPDTVGTVLLARARARRRRTRPAAVRARSAGCCGSRTAPCRSAARRHRASQRRPSTCPSDAAREVVAREAAAPLAKRIELSPGCRVPARRSASTWYKDQVRSSMNATLRDYSTRADTQREAANETRADPGRRRRSPAAPASRSARASLAAHSVASAGDRHRKQRQVALGGRRVPATEEQGVVEAHADDQQHRDQVEDREFLTCATSAAVVSNTAPAPGGSAATSRESSARRHRARRRCTPSPISVERSDCAR